MLQLATLMIYLLITGVIFCYGVEKKWGLFKSSLMAAVWPLILGLFSTPFAVVFWIASIK